MTLHPILNGLNFSVIFLRISRIRRLWACMLMFLPGPFLVFIIATHCLSLAYVILKVFAIWYHWFFPKSPSPGNRFGTCLTCGVFLYLFPSSFIYLKCFIMEVFKEYKYWEREYYSDPCTCHPSSTINCLLFLSLPSYCLLLMFYL